VLEIIISALRSEMICLNVCTYITGSSERFVEQHSNGQRWN